MFRKHFIFVAILFPLLLSHQSAAAGEIIDRIVAIVNGHIILQSDWDDALCFESFTAGQSIQQLTVADRKSALDRLIDQELLREQMQASDFRHASADEITVRIEEIRKQYPGAENDAGWHALLSRYRISEEELKKRVGMELDLLRLVDARLRPTVQIDSRTIESYYSQELLPQLRQSGAREVTLAEVMPKIKELLTQQKVNELLTAWLETLRAGSDIHRDLPPLPIGGQAQ